MLLSDLLFIINWHFYYSTLLISVRLLLSRTTVIRIWMSLNTKIGIKAKTTSISFTRQLRKYSLNTEFLQTTCTRVTPAKQWPCRPHTRNSTALHQLLLNLQLHVFPCYVIWLFACVSSQISCLLLSLHQCWQQGCYSSAVILLKPDRNVTEKVTANLWISCRVGGISETFITICKNISHPGIYKSPWQW